MMCWRNSHKPCQEAAALHLLFTHTDYGSIRQSTVSHEPEAYYLKGISSMVCEFPGVTTYVNKASKSPEGAV